MRPKPIERQLANRLRLKGFSYKEILERIPVSQAILSLWLRDIPLTAQNKQRLQRLQVEGRQRGAARRHQMRLEDIRNIELEAGREIGSLTRKELWLAGVMLYWAEGSKQYEHLVSEGVNFANSDPRMILLFVKWIEEVIGIPKFQLVFELYIHENAPFKRSVSFWSQLLSCQPQQIRVYFKRHIVSSKRHNRGSQYHGVLRINVPKSSRLNRRIAAWIKHICTYWGVD